MFSVSACTNEEKEYELKMTEVKDSLPQFNLDKIEPELRFIFDTNAFISGNFLYKIQKDSSIKTFGFLLIEPFAREFLLIQFFKYKSSGKICYYDINYMKLNDFYFGRISDSTSNYLKDKKTQIVDLNTINDIYNKFSQIKKDLLSIEKETNSKNTFFDGATLYFGEMDSVIVLNSPFQKTITNGLNQILVEAGLNKEIAHFDF